MGNKSKDANRERLEVMYRAITTLIAIFCLLIANEAKLSALSVVDSYYMAMSYVFTVIGVGLLLGVVAKSLLLRQAKESSGLLR